MGDAYWDAGTCYDASPGTTNSCVRQLGGAAKEEQKGWAVRRQPQAHLSVTERAEHFVGMVGLCYELPVIGHRRVG